MEFNYLENMKKLEKINDLCKSIEWHQRSICFSLTNLNNMEDFDEAVDKLEKIANDISALDTDITKKAGWI